MDRQICGTYTDCIRCWDVYRWRITIAYGVGVSFVFFRFPTNPASPHEQRGYRRARGLELSTEGGPRVGKKQGRSLLMAGRRRQYPPQNHTLSAKRAVVLLLLTQTVVHALPNADVPPLVLPGGGSRPGTPPPTGKPQRHNSLNSNSRSNSPGTLGKVRAWHTEGLPRRARPARAPCAWRSAWRAQQAAQQAGGGWAGARPAALCMDRTARAPGCYLTNGSRGAPLARSVKGSVR